MKQGEVNHYSEIDYFYFRLHRSFYSLFKCSHNSLAMDSEFARWIKHIDITIKLKRD